MKEGSARKNRHDDTVKHDFDAQSGEFDRRTGIGDEAARRVASALIELAGATYRATILEIGAGTGEIGHRLLAEGARYLGIDLSEKMLFQARGRKIRRVAGHQIKDPCWTVADADARWPIADSVVACVFASRAAHLLDRGRFVEESRRVCRAGACVVIGRVRRDGAGIKERLRAHLVDVLRGRGIRPREGREHMEELIADLVEAGATRIDEVEAARWTTAAAPAAVLANWRGKHELGGVPLGESDRRSICDEVEYRASNHYSDMHESREQVETYVLAGARWPYESDGGERR